MEFLEKKMPVRSGYAIFRGMKIKNYFFGKIRFYDNAGTELLSCYYGFIDPKFVIDKIEKSNDDYQNIHR